MKTIIFPLFVIAFLGLIIAGCSKNNNNSNPTPANTQATLEGQVLTDYAANLVNPNYIDIQAKAQIMLTASNTFIATPTDANLATFRTAWVNTRTAWESCEGFLFGPVEDFNYDPTMDDWPVNAVDVNALLSSSDSLNVNDITALPTTQKGFHAIEYIIFGPGATRKAADITAREKVFLASLTQSLYNTTTQLRNSWDPSQANNYTVQVTTAGNGSVTFPTRLKFFQTLVGSMADICNEVANEKMQTPLAAQDSTLDESSYSHNSITDFTNNITGVLHAYLSTYNGTSGHSLSELVKSKNASLDITIQSQINAAISSFKGITETYEKAIYNQKSQIATTQTAIRTLKTTLDGQLTTFINTNIKD